MQQSIKEKIKQIEINLEVNEQIELSNLYIDNIESRKLLNETNDCTVRSLSMSLRVSYLDAHSYLRNLGRDNREGFNSAKIFNLEVGETRIFWFYGNQYEITRPPKPNMFVNTFLKAKRKGVYYIVVKEHAYAQINGIAFNRKPENQIIKYYYEIKLINHLTITK